MGEHLTSISTQGYKSSLAIHFTEIYGTSMDDFKCLAFYHLVLPERRGDRYKILLQKEVKWIFKWIFNWILCLLKV